MSSVLAPDLPDAGFSFENCKRNAYLTAKGFPAPTARKTGTTIVGVIYEGGVVLGADTRATEGPIVADKNCAKIHYLMPNIYCCGAGTAADTEMTTKMISSQLELHRMHTGRTVRVHTAVTLIKQMLFRYQGHIGAALVMGGIDALGPHIYKISPHGSTDKLSYAAMGSGSLAAISVLETRWKPDMSEEDAKKLVKDAIRAGIFNDLGSGSNVDLCVIRKTGAEYLRTYEEANKRGQREKEYRYPKGTTGILNISEIPVEIEEVVQKVELPTPMEM